MVQRWPGCKLSTLSVLPHKHLARASAHTKRCALDFHGLTGPFGSKHDKDMIEIGQLRHLLSSKCLPGTLSITVHLK